MNDWTAPSNPHEDHPFFPFDSKVNDPAKDLRWQLGGKRPKRVKVPSNAKEQFDSMCATLLEKIDRFNFETSEYKKTAREKNEQAIANAQINYTAAVEDLNKFMGQTPGVRADYEDFLKAGSFKIEAVVSKGFVIAVRVFGLALFTSSSSSYISTNPSKRP